VNNTIYFVLYSQGTGANSLSLQYVFSGSMPLGLKASMSQHTTATGSAGVQWTQSLIYTYGQSGTTTSSQLTTVQSSGTFTQAIASTTAFEINIGAIDIPFATSLNPGNYWAALGVDRVGSAGGGAITGNQIGFSLSNLFVLNHLATVAQIGAGTNSSYGLYFGNGTYNGAAVTTSSIPLANITTWNTVPYIQFANFA
jgi:hypothetical protein